MPPPLVAMCAKRSSPLMPLNMSLSECIYGPKRCERLQAISNTHFEAILDVGRDEIAVRQWWALELCVGVCQSRPSSAEFGSSLAPGDLFTLTALLFGWRHC